jgi:hypothetical protein
MMMSEMSVFHKLFPFFGRHFLPFFPDRVVVPVHIHVHTTHPTFSDTAKQYAGKNEQAQCLPKIDGRQSENTRYQPIPQ